MEGQENGHKVPRGEELLALAKQNPALSFDSFFHSYSTFLLINEVTVLKRKLAKMLKRKRMGRKTRKRK